MTYTEELTSRATEILAGRDPSTLTQGQLIDAILQAHDERDEFLTAAINDVSTCTERGDAIVRIVMGSVYHKLRA